MIAHGRRRFMNMKLIVAILVTTAMPVYAQAQDRNPVVTAAQRVVEIISSDPAKIETYCAIGKLGVQIEDANEAKDKKTADVLTEKMRGLEKQLGPEYLSLMYGLQTIDPESDDGVEIDAMLKPLDRPCALE
jgi:patatin-like phospholipase/acyl hydrolase